LQLDFVTFLGATRALDQQDKYWHFGAPADTVSPPALKQRTANLQVELMR